MLLDQRVGQLDEDLGVVDDDLGVVDGDLGVVDDDLRVVDDDWDADVFILQCSGESAKNCSTYPTEESCGLTNTCTWTTTTTVPGPTTNANPITTTATTTTTRNTTSSCQPGEQVEIVLIHGNYQDFRGCHQSTPTDSRLS